MKMAITGGTGFVGSHLARELTRDGHEVVVLGRRAGRGDLADSASLEDAFRGCHAVAHCAGINREVGTQTYQRVHLDGTRHVVDAATRAGVSKIVMISFLRARPFCGSPYHETKWAAEEIIRASGLDFTILKAGMTYGKGDHMLDHLSHTLHTAPLLLQVGYKEQPARPLAVEDLIRVFKAALVDHRMSRETVAIVGPEELTLSQAVRRVALAIHRKVLILPAPVFVLRLLARVFELVMKVPLVARAQVRILSEGIDPAPGCRLVPPDLSPAQRFTLEQIQRGLPPAGGFGLRDLRCCHETR